MPNSDKNWQTSCPLQTFVCNISRQLEFIIKQGDRVNWVSGSLDSRVTGSQNVTQFYDWRLLLTAGRAAIDVISWPPGPRQQTRSSGVW